jgi:hypothetical protein
MRLSGSHRAPVHQTTRIGPQKTGSRIGKPMTTGRKTNQRRTTALTRNAKAIMKAKLHHGASPRQKQIDRLVQAAHGKEIGQKTVMTTAMQERVVRPVRGPQVSRGAVRKLMNALRLGDPCGLQTRLVTHREPFVLSEGCYFCFRQDVIIVRKLLTYLLHFSLSQVHFLHAR